MNILIVDDTATARMFAKKCLTQVGFHDANFIMAKNGLEALAKLRSEEVDLILTDLMMPEMDGEELLMAIKQDEKFMEIPVVIVSSAGNKAKEELLLGMGALKVLTKPFSATEIFDILKTFLDEEEDDDDEW